MLEWIDEWWGSDPEGKKELAWLLGLVGAPVFLLGVAGLAFPAVLGDFGTTLGQPAHVPWWLDQGWLVVPGCWLVVGALACKHRASVVIRRMR